MVINLMLVLKLYSYSKKVPFTISGLLLISKRVHSIFLLRLFNDPVAMFFMYASINMLCLSRWEMASILFSIALSIKMNVLLFAPGLAFIFFQGAGIYRSILNSILVVFIQVILGYPFLIEHGNHYISRAFELSRRFLYQWTVNWKFVSPAIFNGANFPIGLLFAHFLLLICFFSFQWTKPKGVYQYLSKGFILNQKRKKLDQDHILVVLFTSNLIGIICARSLHYQFYSWYFYTLPYLLWRTNYHLIIKLIMFFAIEICWNIYPSTAYSSLLLLCLHLALLLGLLVDDKKSKKIKIN
jgi:alpha-1,3-mannosyltransferase